MDFEGSTWVNNERNFGLYYETTELFSAEKIKELANAADMLNEVAPNQVIGTEYGSYVYVVQPDAIGRDNLSNFSMHMDTHWWPGVTTNDVIEKSKRSRGADGMRICQASLKGQPHLHRQICWMMNTPSDISSYVFYQFILADPSLPVPEWFKDKKKNDKEKKEEVKQQFLPPAPFSVSTSSFVSSPHIPEPRVPESPSSSVPLPAAYKCPINLEDNGVPIYRRLQLFVEDYEKALNGAQNMNFTAAERAYYKGKADEGRSRINATLTSLQGLSGGLASVVNNDSPFSSLPAPHANNNKLSNGK